MTIVIQSRDCGNSPKNQFAEKVAIAVEIGDVDFLTEILDESIAWETTKGDFTGAEQVLAQLKNTKESDRLVIDHVVTHGKAGTVNGLAQRNGVATDRRFCHVLTFTNTRCNKVQRITSFSS